MICGWCMLVHSLSMCHWHWSPLQLCNLHQAFTCATSESSCFHILADQAGRECCTAQLGFSLYFNESGIQYKRPLRLSKHFETFLWQKKMKQDEQAQLVTLQYDQVTGRQTIARHLPCQSFALYVGLSSTLTDRAFFRCGAAG